MVLSGMNRESRQFAAAVAVSLLVHLAVLWLAQDFGNTAREKNLTPVFNTIEVALQPARASVERAVAHPERKPGEYAEAPIKHHPESALANSMDIRPSVHKATDAEAVTDAPGADVTASVEESRRASAPNASGSATAPVDSVDTTIRDRYLASVLSKIESHKFYPSPAQRRGLQGRVDVRFTLDAHGGISELDVTGGNSMFVVAARDAINNALPLPAAPSADGFPLAVHYQMIFRLQ